MKLWGLHFCSSDRLSQCYGRSLFLNVRFLSVVKEIEYRPLESSTYYHHLRFLVSIPELAWDFSNLENFLKTPICMNSQRL